MEEIAKIFKINKTGIMQTFIILIICSVAGNIIHDVLMLMENIGLVEKDYTVFPMGSFMVIIGIIATVIFAATTYNYTRFNMDVSYGCTRKMYIIRQWVFDIVVIIMAWAGLGITYLYENWKFAAFYSEYSLELSITPLFHFKYFVVSLIMLSSFNMLISSLIIKYGIKGRRIMAYDIDRNPEEQPSIEEMTRKAIDKLSKNPNGFFLMVEGSKVDWAAHGS